MVKFGDAFAAARKAGKKEFTWSGKRYNTKTKEEAAKKAPKPATRTTARPGSASGSAKAGSSSSKSSGASGSASMKKASTRPYGFSEKRYTGPGK